MTGIGYGSIIDNAILSLMKEFWTRELFAGFRSSSFIILFFESFLSKAKLFIFEFSYISWLSSTLAELFSGWYGFSK